MGSPVRLNATAPIEPAALDNSSARRSAPDELWHSSAAPATGDPAQQGERRRRRREGGAGQ